MNFYIIAADRIIDQKGSHSQTDKIIAKASKLDLNVKYLEIVTLAKRWEDKLNSNEFKSGASAMAAINKARKILSDKKAGIVVIKGKDLLKTGYAKEDRENFMKLYRKKFTPLDGYNKLVPVFLRYHKAQEKDYFTARDALFENYLKTWKNLDPKAALPNERWFEPLTKYFRGVDCANPNTDYSAQLIIANDEAADFLKIPKKDRVKILSNAFIKLSKDGFESIPEVAPYLHLKKAITKAQKEAQVDFKAEFLRGRAALDAYTCYPVVPMGLLLRLGLVKSLEEIPEFLKHHEVTITGGLNLAKAPWNLTSLNSLIALREKLIQNKNIRFGLSHGNGSLGNQQGITILGSV